GRGGQGRRRLVGICLPERRKEDHGRSMGSARTRDPVCCGGGTVVNRENIAKTGDELVEKWKSDHREDAGPS
ncbi:MAG TPA: hypothetical protein VGA72_07645, partial [Anaerolineales bacterium]